MALNTPLKEAKGLGSAKEGTSHFWAQRVTAIGLVPLSLWFVFSMIEVVGKDAWDSMAWIQQPFNAFVLMLFIGIGYYHAYLGMKVIIEDYVHCKYSKTAWFILLQLGLLTIAAGTIFAILRIYFEG